MKHDKLVRDRVPDLIRANGLSPITRVLDEPEFSAALVQKLREEVAEFCDSGEVEELADILEVVYALASDQGVTPEELDKVRGAKRAERGGFNHRLFLVEDGAAS